MILWTVRRGKTPSTEECVSKHVTIRVVVPTSQSWGNEIAMIDGTTGRVGHDRH